MVVLKQKFCVLKTDATNAIYMCCAMQESLWVHLNFVEQKTLLRSDLLWGQNIFELEFFRFSNSSCTSVILNDRDHPFKTSACSRGGGVKNLPNLPTDSTNKLPMVGG